MNLWRCLALVGLLTGCASADLEPCLTGEEPGCVGEAPEVDSPVERTAAPAEPAEKATIQAEQETPLTMAPLEGCTPDALGGLPATDEGPYIGQGLSVEGQRERCTSVRHATAGARGSVLEVTLVAWEGHGPARLSVLDLPGHTLVGPTIVAAGDSVEVPLTRTGEVLVHLEPVDPDEEDNPYSINVECAAGCDGEYTRFPVVLLHGLGGAESFGDLNYYFRVMEVLEPMGFALHTPGVSPFSTPEERALQWEAHLEDLVAEGAGRRFNLIAHSQAGLDARYLVSVLDRSDLVASVVTIATPHHGTPLGDLLYGLVEDEVVDGYWVDLGASSFAELFGLAGDDQSLVNAMGSMTLETVAEFNAQVPDHEDVYYASWSGLSCGALDFACQSACGGEKVDPVLAATHFILWLQGIPNDGMVPVESAIWGDHQGQICADHADQVGLFGDTANEAFDHLDFYLQEFRRLGGLQF